METVILTWPLFRSRAITNCRALSKYMVFRQDMRKRITISNLFDFTKNFENHIVRRGDNFDRNFG